MEKVLQQLTLKEKLGQLVMIAPFFFEDVEKHIYGPLLELKLDRKDIFLTGSVLGIGSKEDMHKIQRSYLNRSNTQVPLIFMADVIHGCKTITPTPLSQACSFNPKLVKEASIMAAREALSSGIHVTFSPMTDLVKDPRWGRVVESYGEDPHLHYIYAKATVEGYKKTGLLSCAKHFVGYGLSEAGRDYNSVDLSRINLYNNYLSGFKGAIEAGVDMVMTSFNTFEYVPATINKYLLQDVLREELKFEGVTIADYDALLQTITHNASNDEFDAAVKGIKSGLDIEMASSSYMRHLEKAVKEGIIKEEWIDKAVLRVLKLKEKAQLFEKPYTDYNHPIFTEETKECAYKLAKESLVLLKNTTLPLKDEKVALLGKYATSNNILGPWSWHGDIAQTPSLDQEIEAIYVDDSEYFDAYDLSKLKQANHILLAIGEDPSESGEAHSKTNINLPPHLVKLIKDLKTLNLPLTVILYTGRPLILSEVIDDIDNLILHFFLGTMTSKAISKTLYGFNNPSGRLPITLPRHSGQVPIYYNHLPTGRPYHKDNPYTSHYMDCDNEPLFPFGFGLSYSTFIYKDLHLSSREATLNNLPVVSVTITNTSQVEGMVSVLLYIKDEKASMSRPVKELKQFQKVNLKGNQTKTLTFTIQEEDLSFYNQDLKKVIEPGQFSIYIENLETSFILKGDTYD